jgi:hypothetical protein
MTRSMRKLFTRFGRFLCNASRERRLLFFADASPEKGGEFLDKMRATEKGVENMEELQTLVTEIMKDGNALLDEKDRLNTRISEAITEFKSDLEGKRDAATLDVNKEMYQKYLDAIPDDISDLIGHIATRLLNSSVRARRKGEPRIPDDFYRRPGGGGDRSPETGSLTAKMTDLYMRTFNASKGTRGRTLEGNLPKKTIRLRNGKTRRVTDPAALRAARAANRGRRAQSLEQYRKLADEVRAFEDAHHGVDGFISYGEWVESGAPHRRGKRSIGRIVYHNPDGSKVSMPVDADSHAYVRRMGELASARRAALKAARERDGFSSYSASQRRERKSFNTLWNREVAHRQRITREYKRMGLLPGQVRDSSSMPDYHADALAIAGQSAYIASQEDIDLYKKYIGPRTPSDWVTPDELGLSPDDPIYVRSHIDTGEPGGDGSDYEWGAGFYKGQEDSMHKTKGPYGVRIHGGTGRGAGLRPGWDKGREGEAYDGRGGRGRSPESVSFRAERAGINERLFATQIDLIEISLGEGFTQKYKNWWKEHKDRGIWAKHPDRMDYDLQRKMSEIETALKIYGRSQPGTPSEGTVLHEHPEHPIMFKSILTAANGLAPGKIMIVYRRHSDPTKNPKRIGQAMVYQATDSGSVFKAFGFRVAPGDILRGEGAPAPSGLSSPSDRVALSYSDREVIAREGSREILKVLDRLAYADTARGEYYKRQLKVLTEANRYSGISRDALMDILQQMKDELKEA